MATKRPLANYAGAIKELQTGDILPVAEADVTFTDITTNDVSITKHGYVPRAPNDSSVFLNGLGAYSSPPGASDLAQSNRLPASDRTITADYSAIVVGDFEIASGFVLEIANNGVLEIT